MFNKMHIFSLISKAIVNDNSLLNEYAAGMLILCPMLLQMMIFLIWQHKVP